MDIRTFSIDRSLLIQSKEQQRRSPLIQLKERSLPFQSNDQQPTQSLCQVDVQVLLWVVLFQLSSPPQPSTAVHAYDRKCTCIPGAVCTSTPSHLPDPPFQFFEDLVPRLVPDRCWTRPVLQVRFCTMKLVENLSHRTKFRNFHHLLGG